MNAYSPLLNVPRLAKLRVDDFLLLNENGAFDEYAKTELIEGEIFCMNAQLSRHGRAKSLLNQRLAEAVKTAKLPYEVWVETSVRLSDRSMPEPDIIITSFRGRGAIPLADVALIVEVSDTTLNFDLGQKATMYADAGVSEYWVLDVENHRLLVLNAPSAGRYTESDAFPLGVDVTSRTLPGVTVPTGGLVD